jgi:hypothetical protein
MKAAAALLLFCCAATADAGPWTRKAGEGFVWVGFTTIGYSRIYDDGGVKQSLAGSARDNVIRIAAENGLGSGFVLSAAIPFAQMSFTPDTGARVRTSGIGDVDLGLRRSWNLGGGHVGALELLSTLPTGDNNNAEGLLLGTGEWGFLLGPSWAKSFHPLPLYVSASAGVRVRTGEYSHEFRYGVEAGYGLFDDAAMLILDIAGQESFGNRPTRADTPRPEDVRAAGLGLLNNNREYLAITPKLLLRPGHSWGIVLSYATAAKGRNVAGGAVLGAGVYRAF